DKDHRLSALQASIMNRQMVLLGDPGSGKSTFLSHLVLCLAAHGLEPQAGWLTSLPNGPLDEAAIVPICVILRGFARSLSERIHKAEPEHLWNFIRDRLTAQNLAFAAEILHDKLEQGQAILLLDGLDEIPTTAQRTFVREAIMACARRYDKCRTIITCRT